jgi:hypothetical protein
VETLCRTTSRRSQSEFDEARRQMQGKRRGGVYRGGNCQKSTSPENLLTGLVHDIGFGPNAEVRPMHFQNVRATCQYLMSSFRADKPSNRIRYCIVERAILRHLSAEDGNPSQEKLRAPK